MKQNQFNTLAAQAREHHRAGRLREAEAMYRQLLKEEPYDADLLHLLGLVALQSGDARAASDWFTRAIGINPANPAFHGNLGMACRQLGRLDQTIESFRKASELCPDLPEALFNLGSALQEAKRFDEAIKAFENCLKLRPGFAPPCKSWAAFIHCADRVHGRWSFLKRHCNQAPPRPIFSPTMPAR